ncbi:DUF4159 domain-containing protein [Candidatus Latescibacterota bacterium]
MRISSHELAHIKRRDHIINFLQVIIQAVYFFHPLIWFVNRRIRNLREQLSDDLAIYKLGQENSRYSKSILRAMENVMNDPAFGFIGIGFSERKSFAGERIKRVMDTNYINMTKMTLRSIMIVVLVATAGLFASCGQMLVKEKSSDMTKHSALNTNKFNVAIVIGSTLKPPEDMNRAVENVVATITRQSEIKAITHANVRLDSPGLKEYPMIFMSADKAFKLTPNEAKNLGTYLRNGGFAFIENGTPEYIWGGAEESLRIAIRDALDTDSITLPIPNNHPVYHVFSDFDNGPPIGSEITRAGKIISERSGKTEGIIERPIPYLEGIWIDNRLVAMYSDKGYVHMWSDSGTSTPQMKMGENLVLYAATQKGGLYNKSSQPNAAEPVKVSSGSPIQLKPLQIDTTSQPNTVEPVKITVLDDGTYMVGDIHVTKADLKEVMKAELAKKPSSIIISGEPVTTFKDITFVMDIANEFEVKGMSIKLSPETSNGETSSERSDSNSIVTDNNTLLIKADINAKHGNILSLMEKARKVHIENERVVQIMNNNEFMIGNKIVSSSDLLNEFITLKKEKNINTVYFFEPSKTLPEGTAFVKMSAKNAGIDIIVLASDAKSRRK